MAARISEAEFLERALQRFGDRFDYSGIHYRSYKSPIKILCRKHPVQQICITPEKHLQTTGGCRHCVREKRVEALERELNRGPSSERAIETSASVMNQVIGKSAGVLLLLLLAPSALVAGSITAESVWDAQDATERAQQQVPQGNTVTDTQCTTIQVRESDRYRCTVFYNEKAQPISPPD